MVSLRHLPHYVSILLFMSIKLYEGSQDLCIILLNNQSYTLCVSALKSLGRDYVFVSRRPLICSTFTIKKVQKRQSGEKIENYKSFRNIKS